MKRHKKRVNGSKVNCQDYDLLAVSGRILLDLFIIVLFYVKLRVPLGLP
jgi:hypothetical protein